MKNNTNKNVAGAVRELVAPVATEMGYFIWDVEFCKEGADKYLRITLDNEDGINIEDCEKVHRAIDPILDEIDPIEGFYYLDVSSPGLEREIRTDEHIAAMVGAKVEAKLYAARDGKKSIIGSLVGLDGDLVVINDGEDVKLPRADISRLTTLYFED